MEANTASLVKYNTGSYNPRNYATVSGNFARWDAELEPMTCISDAVATAIITEPNAPIENGMMIAIIWQAGIVGQSWALGSTFSSACSPVENTDDTQQTRVYVGISGLWHEVG